MRIPMGHESVALLLRAQDALGMNQARIGELFGVSRRTIIRWTRGGCYAGPEAWARVAAAVHAKDPALAATLASELGETLESLAIVPPAAPVRPLVTPRDLTLLVVHAAAEAAALAPQAIVPALAAAFDRAASLGLSVDDVRAGLAAGVGKGAKKP
jgi:hypothetical protein